MAPVATSEPTEQTRDLLASKLRSPTNGSSSKLPGNTNSSDALKRANKVAEGDAAGLPPIPLSSNPEPVADKKETNAPTPQPPLPHYDEPKPLLADSQTIFVKPKKRIVSPASMQRFHESKAFEDIMGFVVALNGHVRGKKLSDEVAMDETVKGILTILESVSRVVDETPPVSNAASRFGNPAFRELYLKIKQHSRQWHESIPGLKGKVNSSASSFADSEAAKNAIDEISVYFEESWGNGERIDYGSGMELNFLCWLLCLVKLSILSLSTHGATVVLKIFWSYIQLMRKIQSTYWLEPAGSHGVWGLDDYHFLPFVWGSSQLATHRHLRPKSIHDPEILAEFQKEYMYLACIHFINEIKTASLRWHSPMLDDISSVKTWSKVNEGMLKMYKAEVLSKLPIAQHIFFGSILAFPAPKNEEEEAEDAAAMTGSISEGQVCASGHVHSHGPVGEVPGVAPDKHATGQGQAAGWGDCCGIPIPSVFAAAQDEKEKSKTGSGVAMGMGVKRVPFD